MEETKQEELIEFDSKPPVYTETEKKAFLDALEKYRKDHPIMRPSQKKVRSRMTNLIPKKKKRK